MHPAFSVIFFTTAAGAGYGLMALLGIFAVVGALPADRWLGLASMGTALALVTAGLLSSTAHLGHPERAWRAFSQWRSSWLSREGVASVVTYIPAGLFAIGWVFFARTSGWVAVAGIVASLCAVATLIATGMIYASLKPIPQWASSYTVPGYLIYAAMSGAVLLDALLQIWHLPNAAVEWLAVATFALGWAWKIATWRHNDALPLPATAASATGLTGTVRSVEWPHTEENYLLKEMGYRIARKHAAKLRVVVQVLAFAVPLLATILALLLGGIAALVLTLIAVVALAPGLLVERWLFFAEAKHVVTLYYGR
jgi:DMSO reductase anchor subunit